MSISSNNSWATWKSWKVTPSLSQMPGSEYVGGRQAGRAFGGVPALWGPPALPQAEAFFFLMADF